MLDTRNLKTRKINYESTLFALFLLHYFKKGDNQIFDSTLPVCAYFRKKAHGMVFPEKAH